VIREAEQANKDIAVVLCDCGGTLRSPLDFDRLRKHISGMSEVAAVHCCSNLCRQKQCLKAIESVSKKHPKRLVIGACDREVFGEDLRKAMASVSLNEGLLWCVNIREHCGWVTSEPDAATDKAIAVLSAAVRRVGLASAVKSKKTAVNQAVLVVGGGVSAMQTAVGLSQLGHRVTLATKANSLGGQSAKTPQLYAYVADAPDDAEALVQSRIDRLISLVSNDGRIDVQTTASLKSIQGSFGSFTATVDSRAGKQTVAAGAIVLATDEASSPLSAELAQLIHGNQDIPKRIAIVMDLSGEQGRDVSAQVLSAAELLAKRFAVRVKVYCHHIRVASTGLENLYRRTREAGVVIVKYETPPVISEQGIRKVVRCEEPTIGKEISEEFELVIIADVPVADGNSELLNLIEFLRAGPDGVLQYDNVWLLPTKTNLEGIFVAGWPRGNSSLRDAQADGMAAANRIHELLKDKQIEVLDDAPVVDEDKCVLCLTCMRVCPHGAISIDLDNKAASVSAVTCRRCGICAALCPAAAIQLPRYTDEQITAEIHDTQYHVGDTIIVFACENSAYPAATAAAINRTEYPANIRLIRVPCAGKVDSRQVLQVLEAGAEKVLILGCHRENCQYLTGSDGAAKRFEHLNSELTKAGVDKKQVIFGQLASVEPTKFLQFVKDGYK